MMSVFLYKWLKEAERQDTKIENKSKPMKEEERGGGGIRGEASMHTRKNAMMGDQLFSSLEVKERK